MFLISVCIYKTNYNMIIPYMFWNFQEFITWNLLHVFTTSKLHTFEIYHRFENAFCNLNVQHFI